MEVHTLRATSREPSGKGGARKVRKSGMVPGVLYRQGRAAAALSFDVADLAAVFRKTADPNTLIHVALDGAELPCLVREIQRDPVSRDVLHVDFHQVAADEPVVVDVAVNAVGRAVGTRAGGRLRVIARSLTVRCPAGSIPARIDVDVTNVDVGQFIRASQVVPPPGVQVVFRQDFNVVTVEGKRAAAGAAAADSAETAAESAKAAPAKAAAKPAPAKK